MSDHPFGGGSKQEQREDKDCPRCGKGTLLTDDPLIGKRFTVELLVCHGYDEDLEPWVWVTGPLGMGEMMLKKSIRKYIEKQGFIK